MVTLRHGPRGIWFPSDSKPRVHTGAQKQGAGCVDWIIIARFLPNYDDTGSCALGQIINTQEREREKNLAHHEHTDPKFRQKPPFFQRNPETKTRD